MSKFYALHFEYKKWNFRSGTALMSLEGVSLNNFHFFHLFVGFVFLVCVNLMSFLVLKLLSTIKFIKNNFFVFNLLFLEAVGLYNIL